ncbi:two-component system, OmpR family, sensor histidine kinase KdpD [Ketogulonicigenium robustum]|uniref:histidine kinase n=1 Tax=Ketogulonicigenium robustum TaxID=92947 RepID=A0A1W6NW42_9RHOB|nr:ATP-binding protein [Ketogulonicigenium robustum]ARO13431.1 two-component system, OmpR family, sensor histidine kinase KdpD [Ketogulonicigenium robustum]
MSKLGLGARLMLVILFSMLVLQILSVVVYISDRGVDALTRRAAMFPDRLEAIVTLMDHSNAEQRGLLVRSISDEGTTISWTDDIPALGDGIDARSGEVVVPGFGAWLSDYSDMLGSHQLQVVIPREGRHWFLPNLSRSINTQQVRVSVRLADGTWVNLYRHPVRGLFFAGIPLGVFTALFLAGVALLSMAIIWRETNPLRRLAAAAEDFGRDLEPRPLPVPRPPDLRVLVLAFNRMQQNIAQADRSRSDMIAALSHDIRTPLARLTLRIRKLDSDLRAAAEHDIDQITRVADGAFRFTETEMARLEETMDLRHLLRDITADYDLPLQDPLPQRLALMQGHVGLLDRAFSNLIENAGKYAQTVRVKLVAGPQPRDGRGCKHMILFDDDGPGIPPEDRARLLQPFQRGQTARTDQSEGVGLGLYLANRIIERHGGSLELEASPAGGLRVKVLLPALVAGASDKDKPLMGL